MKQRSERKADRGTQFSLLRVTLVALVAVVGVLYAFGRITRPPHKMTSRLACANSLKALYAGLALYLDEYGEYPAPETWCDSLANHLHQLAPEAAEQFRKGHCCPEVGDQKWAYAMNPLANGRSAPDVVLLFESDEGWNAQGGADALAAGRHRGTGCNVLFADGSVRFVGKEAVVQLRWQGGLYDETQPVEPPASAAPSAASGREP